MNGTSIQRISRNFLEAPPIGERNKGSPHIIWMVKLAIYEKREGSPLGK